MSKIKVQGYNNLARDLNSNAIVNTDKNEYDLYMRRAKQREHQSDEIRNAIKEINMLKTELYEIKELIKGTISK